jgi:hypothetical protein
MYLTLPKIIAGIAMLACFSHSKVSAQESISQNSTDLSFEIIVKSEADRQYVDICTEALLRYDNLDEYRFVHSNRTVSFQKLNIEVNLLSAKSLYVSSGRFIQNACIDHDEIYSDVEFRLIIQDDQYCISPIFINEKEHICP